jgi:exosortase
LSSTLYFLPLAGYWLVLIYYLGAQWSAYEQYNYGWAVPVLCGYLLYARIRAGDGRLEIGDSRPGGGSHLPSSIFYLLLALCALLYAPTRFLHEANPIWRLSSLLWALEVIGLTLLFIRSALGATSAHRDLVTCPFRPPFLLSAFCFSDFVFPVCFFLVAVPWPSGLEGLLTQSLMRFNTATTVELLGAFGVPAIRHGNVIEIATGSVGIDEACSGIRSLQATLMISLFLGEFYALTVWRRALCVLAGFALAFVFNVGRTLLLTRVAATKGVGAVASWHDPAGVTILVACFLSLWALAALGAKRRGRQGESRKQKAEMGTAGLEVRGQRAEGSGQSVAQASSPASHASVPAGMSPNFQAEGSKSDVPLAPSHLPSSIFHLRSLSVVLLVWLLLVEAGVQVWYRSHERTAVASTEWSVPRPAQGSSYHEVEMPPSIRGQFRSDESLQTRWQDGAGNSWQLYYFRWMPGRSLQKRVTIQLAKTHGPETCLPAAGMSLKSYLGVITVPIAGMELAMQQYVFNAEGTPLHVFYGIYEDPSGSTQLANRRKNSASRLSAALIGSRNYGQRFLEVAVFGYEKPEEARAALTGELEKLIKIEGPTNHGPF